METYVFNYKLLALRGADIHLFDPDYAGLAYIPAMR